MATLQSVGRKLTKIGVVQLLRITIQTRIGDTRFRQNVGCVGFICRPTSKNINATLLAFAADRRAAAAQAVQQLIDISRAPGPQQQTRRTPRLQSNI